MSQGYKLMGAIKTAERKLLDGTLRHAGQALLAWAVGNAKIELKGNAVMITKQLAGTGKIDPLMAVFDAVRADVEQPRGDGPQRLQRREGAARRLSGRLMGLVSRIRAAFGARAVEKSQGSAGIPAQGFLPTLGATPSATSLLISAGNRDGGFRRLCLRHHPLAGRRALHAAPVREGEGGRREAQAHHQPSGRQAVPRPNERQNWFEFAEQVNAGYLLRGNGYAAIQHDSRGQPVGLIPINPDAAMVLEAADGQIFYNVNRVGLWQMAMLKEFPVTIPAEDMFHLRGLTFNALVAASTINLARDSIGVAMALEQQAARWMANGARPSVVLQTKKSLNKEAADRLKQQWNDLFGGLMNVGRTAVLEDGIEAKPLALTTADIEYIAQRNFQLIDIARFYRMPPLKLGLDRTARRQPGRGQSGLRHQHHHARRSPLGAEA